MSWRVEWGGTFQNTRQTSIESKYEGKNETWKIDSKFNVHVMAVS